MMYMPRRVDMQTEVLSKQSLKYSFRISKSLHTLQFGRRIVPFARSAAHQPLAKERVQMRNYLSTALAAMIVSLFASALAPPASAGILDDILVAPKTLIDRAIEARSSTDIFKDNEIVIKVNAIMADLTTIKASTEIYEQRLLVTGLFDDVELYEEFLARVEAVDGVKELYWHVQYMSAEEQEAREEEMLDWMDALELDARVGISLIETAGIADVNLRVAVDAFSSVYLIGRARSEEEMRKAVKVSSETQGAGVVINYIDMRP